MAKEPEVAQPNPYNMDQYTEKTGPEGGISCPPGYVMSVFGTCEVPHSDPWAAGHVGGGMGRYIGAHIAGFAGHQTSGGGSPPTSTSALNAYNRDGLGAIKARGGLDAMMKQANDALTASFFRGGFTGTPKPISGLREGPAPSLSEAEKAQTAEGLDALHELTRRGGGIVKQVQQNIEDADGVEEEWFDEEFDEPDGEEELGKEDEGFGEEELGESARRKGARGVSGEGFGGGIEGEGFGGSTRRRKGGVSVSGRAAEKRAVEGFLGGRPNALRESMGLSRRHRQGALSHLSPRGRF